MQNKLEPMKQDRPFLAKDRLQTRLSINIWMAYVIRIFSFILVLMLLSGCVSHGVYSQDRIGGPFKDYDTACRDSIMHRWGTLLDGYKRDRIGKVELQFRLNYDGSITDMKVLDASVGAEQVAICQKAVSFSAPFSPWPQDMIRMVGANYRVITFTFNYYK